MSGRLTARKDAGFFTLQIAGLVLCVTLLISASLAWQIQIRHVAKGHTAARQMAYENDRLSTVVSALVRKNLNDNNPALFTDVDPVHLNPFLTSDPRFPGLKAGDVDTPGFQLVALTVGATPAILQPHPIFAVGRGPSPLARLRQIAHMSSMPYAMSRRLAPTDDSALLDTYQGGISVLIREIPLTQFSLIAFENLNIGLEGGIRFIGTSLVMGDAISSGPNAPSTFDLRITPRPVPDAQIGLSEQVWEAPGLAASLITAPGTMLDINSSTIQQQNLARRGVPIYFDGHSLTSEAALPPGIVAGLSVGQVTRAIVNIAQLPLSNVLLDSSSADAPDNRIAAFHIVCTTPLARDRGVVIVGDQDPNSARLCDVITTNGTLILEGQHTAGPLIVGSSMGGVLFNNTAGDVTWNAYLVMTAPSPFTSGVGDNLAPTGVRTRQFSLVDGKTVLTPGEQGFDSIGLAYDPQTSTDPFQIGWGSKIDPNTMESGLWLDSDGTALRVGARDPDGLPVYSDATPSVPGQILFSYSRSQNTVRVLMSDGSVFTRALASFVPGRTRIETKEAIWTGVSSDLNIITNPSGTALGTLYAGKVKLRGLCCLGTITRFGPGTFEFRPEQDPTIRESVIPRLIVSGR